MTTTAPTTLNGIDLPSLKSLADDVAQDYRRGLATFHVRTGWTGGVTSETRIDHWELGGRSEPRGLAFRADEPTALLGKGESPNPQELLMGAINACMLVGYVAGCALRGIIVRSLEIETTGTLDLRGFLGLDPTVKPGYDQLSCVVRIDADATRDQLEEVHEAVQRTSPNFWNITQQVPIKATLVKE